MIRRRFRSAITGRIVKAATAKRHPDATVAETVHLAEPLDAQRDDALILELAGVLSRIVANPHRSHPGRPAVSYQHLSEATHDRAIAALRRVDERERRHG